MKKIAIFMFILSTPLFSTKPDNKFSFTKVELLIVIADLDLPVKIKIAKEYDLFLGLIEESLIFSDINFDIVDKNRRLSSDYIPPNMLNLSDYDLYTRYRTMLFCDYAIRDFINMSNDAKKDNIEIFIASTYRSYQFQNKIFTNMKNYHGEEKAATIVAYPGASQHQLGICVDFGSIEPSFAYTDSGKWLLENSWKYGFSLSYPEGLEEITTYIYEPWHYRYIGIPGAKLQKIFFEDKQFLFLEFVNKYREFFQKYHIQQD